MKAPILFLATNQAQEAAIIKAFSKTKKCFTVPANEIEQNGFFALTAIEPETEIIIITQVSNLEKLKFLIQAKTILWINPNEETEIKPRPALVLIGNRNLQTALLS